MMIGFVGMIIVITPQKILCRTVEEKFQLLNKEILSHQCLHTLDIVRHKPTLLKRITLDTSLPPYRFPLPIQPSVFTLTGLKPAHFRIPDIPVSLPFPIIGLCLILVSQTLP